MISRTFILTLSAILMLTCRAYGGSLQPFDDPITAPIDHPRTISIRTAAFFPSDSFFRKIYDNAAQCFEIELTQKWNSCFALWENFDWFSKKGGSIGFKDHTRISIGNISLGIKYIYFINHCLNAYVGIGPSLGIVWIEDDFHSGKHKRNGYTAFGGVIKTGINYYFAENWFLDIFVDYLYQPHHFKREVDLGGTKLGVGIGYAF